AGPTYRFDHWSDAGTQVHDMVGPGAAATVTAFFNQSAGDVPGLVSEWLLDGNANDAFGTNHGTLVGGATFVSDDVRGLALSCNGTDAAVSVANTTSANFSWAAWVRTTAVSPTGGFAYQGSGLIWSDVGGSANDFTLAVLGDRLSEFEGE